MTRKLTLAGCCTRNSMRLAVGWTLLLALAQGGMAKAVEFPDAGDRGAPERTAGGGTRGEWCEGMTWTPWSITALVPSNNVSTFAGEQASLWLYVAAGFNEKTAELYVQDPETRKTVHEQQIQLTGLENGGLVKVDLPASNAAGDSLLGAGKDYYWEFSVICNESDRAQDYIVQGLLNRVEVNSSLLENLASASLAQQLEQFASAGLWQETLQVSDALKSTDLSQWEALLTSVGLDMLIPELTPPQTGQSFTEG